MRAANAMLMHIYFKYFNAFFEIEMQNSLPLCLSSRANLIVYQRCERLSIFKFFYFYSKFNRFLNELLPWFYLKFVFQVPSIAHRRQCFGHQFGRQRFLNDDQSANCRIQQLQIRASIGRLG